MKPQAPPTDPPGIEMTTVKVIKLKAQDRATLRQMAATYGVTDPIDFCHGIIIAADRQIRSFSGATNKPKVTRSDVRYAFWFRPCDDYYKRMYCCLNARFFLLIRSND